MNASGSAICSSSWGLGDDLAKADPASGNPFQPVLLGSNEVRVRGGVVGLQDADHLALIAVRELELEGDPPPDVLRRHEVPRAHRRQPYRLSVDALDRGGSRLREGVRVDRPREDLQAVDDARART